MCRVLSGIAGAGRGTRKTTRARTDHARKHIPVMREFKATGRIGRAASWVLTHIANLLGSKYKRIEATGIPGLFTVYFVARPATVLTAHERWHWIQAKRMGYLKFYLAWLFYTLRYGYWKNPLESEARVVSAKIVEIIVGTGMSLKDALELYEEYYYARIAL